MGLLGAETKPQYGSLDDFLRSGDAMALAAGLLANSSGKTFGEALGAGLLNMQGAPGLDRQVKQMQIKKMQTEMKAQQDLQDALSAMAMPGGGGMPAQRMAPTPPQMIADPAMAGQAAQQGQAAGIDMGGGVLNPDLRMRLGKAQIAAGNVDKGLELMGITRPNFGQPVQAMDKDGNIVYLQVDKQGQSRVLPGYAPVPRKGTNMTFNPETGEFSFEQGGVDRDGTMMAPSQKTSNELQGDISKQLESLGRLDQIGKDYKSSYLTYAGAGRGALASFMNKATGNSYDKKFLQGRTKFVTGMEQLFNQYRKEITGAAAAVQELDRLKKSMLNTDMSPDQFEAAFEQFKNISTIALKTKQQLLREGIPLGSKEFGRRIDEAVFSSSTNNAATDQQGQATSQSTDSGQSKTFTYDPATRSLK